jgi:hypothetical protein
MPAETELNYNSWTAGGREESRPFVAPSGNKCLIRDLELDDVLELGLLDKIDSLTAIVQDEHIDRVAGTSKKASGKGKKPKPEKSDVKQMSDLFKDKEKREDITDVINLIAMTCVVEPKLHDPWILDPNAASAENPTGRRKLEKNERDPELAYLDYVNFVDKITLFHEVFGGMERLQQFREEADQSLGNVADESGSEQPAV